MQPFREMPDVLGDAERQEAAIQDFGRWRARTRTGVLLVFALVGLIPAGLGYWFAQELQFRYNENVASMHVNVAGGAVAWIAMFFVGAWVSRRVVLRRMPAKLAQLATAYEVPVAELAKTTDLIRDL
jgi:uncharacterized membrane protein